MSRGLGSYAGSKRAIEIMADTLRLEVAPFGVGVLCVVTGAVQTNGQTYFTNYSVPENSLYKPIEATIVKRAQGHDGLPRMETIQYANAVVDEIVKRNSGKFWFGEQAESTKAGTTGPIASSTMVS